jgi:hypothetical protein
LDWIIEVCFVPQRLRLRRLIIPACALASLLVLLVVLWKDKQDSSWHGKSLPQWAMECRAGNTNAIAALNAMGPRAVPGLIRLLHTRYRISNTVWKWSGNWPRYIGRQVQNQLPPPWTALSMREAAAHSLGALGPTAAAAANDLGTALSDHEGNVMWETSSALGKIGPAAIPVLIPKLSDNDYRIRHATHSTSHHDRVSRAFGRPAGFVVATGRDGRPSVHSLHGCRFLKAVSMRSNREANAAFC